MEYDFGEFKKISELEDSILTVENLVDILIDYNGEKDYLIEILSEKAALMKNKLDEFTSLLIKN